MAASAVASAQTSTKPTTATNSAPAAGSAATAPWVKLPPGVPRAHGIVKIAFSLRYEDIKIGTGKDAEPNKSYKVMYTGWLASTGYKFDSSYDHRMPVMGKDGKPEMGEDGKPKMGDPQPITIAQGFGRVIPGFDQGFYGMKVGGKRRIFIPWQLAYGARGRPGPDAAHPGIPPKSDLIFDIELLDVTDLQLPQGHPGMGGMPGGRPIQIPPHPGTPGAPGTQAPQGAPGTPPTTQTPAPPQAAPSTTPAPNTTPAPAPAQKPPSQ
jgi:peptidylprolyl isomerase